MRRRATLAPSPRRLDPREPPNEAGACLSALRGPGHLHDRGAEEVLQCHEEAGLQEAPEAHPTAPGESGSQFGGSGEDLPKAGAGKPPHHKTDYRGLFSLLVQPGALGLSRAGGASSHAQGPQSQGGRRQGMRQLWEPRDDPLPQELLSKAPPPTVLQAFPGRAGQPLCNRILVTP